MDYLKKDIDEIITFVEKLPEKYQQKAFEVMLSNLLNKGKKEQKTEDDGNDRTSIEIPIPVEIKGLFKKHNMPMEEISKIFYIEKNEISPIYELNSSDKTTMEVQLALLISLENLLEGKTDKLEFSIEDVREKCKELRCYDTTNFNTYLKKRKILFKDLNDKEHVILSNDGKNELGILIKELVKNE